MMRKRIQTVLLAAAVAFPGLPAFARAAPQPDAAKTAALTAGRAALEDGLFDIAEKQFLQFLRRASTREEHVEGTLLFARALFGQGRYRECLQRLQSRSEWAKGTEDEPAFAYWAARTRFEMGDYTGALGASEDLRRKHPESPYRVLAARLRAKCYVQAKQYDEALDLYAAIDGKYGDSPEAPDNLLDWAGTLIDLGRRDEARGILERLTEKYPASDTAVKARLWMGRLYADRKEWDKAIEALLALANQPDARSDRRAAAWLAIAQLHEARTNFPAAIDALERGGAVIQDPFAKVRNDVCRGQLLIRVGRADEGIAILRESVKAMPNELSAADVQRDFAQVLLDQRLYDKSLEEFQRYLDAFDGRAGVATAQAGKGWCLWGLGRYAEAASTFEKAYMLQDDSEGKAQCLLKAADAYFANEQFTAAAERYNRVSEEFPASAVAAQARLQSAECLARLGRRDDAEKAFRDLAESSGPTALSGEALLRLARLKEEGGEWEQAMATYDRVATACTNDAVCARAVHGRGLIRYRLGQFKEALGDFERVVNEWPLGDMAEQAFYMRGWCLYLLGNDADALALCQAFIEKYPESAWEPDVLFWLGEYSYNHGDYANAEKRFSELAQRHAQGSLADHALYWAGRSAAGGKEYVRAIEYYTLLAKNHPDSPRVPEARFAQGDALSELGQFATAILAFDEIIAKYPRSYLVDLAWGRKGDCQFTLGKDDPKRYEEALTSYRVVRESPRASRDLKAQAEYKMGRCREKAGQLGEALELYMNVVYTYLAEAHQASAGDPLWFTRAAFSAAAIKESQEKWREAVSIYRRVVNVGVPAAAEAQARIQRIRVEHWVLF
jgi:TolA-binding protein